MARIDEEIKRLKDMNAKLREQNEHLLRQIDAIKVATTPEEVLQRYHEAVAHVQVSRLYDIDATASYTPCVQAQACVTS